MATNSTSANTLIVDQVSSMLVEPLQAASVVLAAGPTIFQSSEPLRVPTLNNSFNPEWVGENELIPDGGTADFGEIELMPTSRKSIKTIVRVSNELIRMATVGVSAVLQRRVVSDVRHMLDNALLQGDGADDTVTGLMNQGYDVTTIDPADPDGILSALAELASREVTPNRMFMSGADFYTIRGLKDNDGRYLLQSDITAGVTTYRLHGVPVTVTNKLQPGQAWIGDMKDVVVVRDRDATVTILNERYAEYDQTGIRVTTRYDLGNLSEESGLILGGAE